MDCEDSYQARVLAIAAVAKHIEERWAQASDENKKRVESKPSFNIHGGGYRTMGWMQGHRDYSRTLCARCGGSSIACEEVVAGCRHNGDGYGSNVNYCNDCGFLSWCSYDEA